MNSEKKAKLIDIYKKYKALSDHLSTNYKLSINDLAILAVIEENCSKQNMLMQPFLKIATKELELSRTKVLASIRKLINQDRVSKVRSEDDERKVYLFMNEDNTTSYRDLLDEVEAFIDK
ncbi:MarR family transcriptional regulator [Staphylococcus sp. SQ8-PEA]|uniref:MarR family transcriptional regulator n=1 Tax=Staphylococcus marylandisciuri TaxID=2981529 RepID=A0ABT2QP53_9STAP|nr:MarR family transcriptional regulator [Staphylococcus marylandisciuri]MCU5745765.1 MarR family transcriptional regulator [Staphylococcus marylandisciuri]